MISAHLSLLAITAGLMVAAVAEPTVSEAPNFKLALLDGTTVEFNKLNGKVVVLNFWATWCGPCKAEIPGFLEVYDKYREEGLEIVGISLDRGPAPEVRNFVKRYNINYPVGIDDGTIADLYGGIQAIPTTFVIDRTGRIVKQHVGFMNASQFETLVKNLL
ncbi:MAG: TlpA disulfide reductase family protein [Bacteroidota bacterium]